MSQRNSHGSDSNLCPLILKMLNVQLFLSQQLVGLARNNRGSVPFCRRKSITGMPTMCSCYRFSQAKGNTWRTWALWLEKVLWSLYCLSRTLILRHSFYQCRDAIWHCTDLYKRSSTEWKHWSKLLLPDSVLEHNKFKRLVRFIAAIAVVAAAEGNNDGVVHTWSYRILLGFIVDSRCAELKRSPFFASTSVLVYRSAWAWSCQV